MHNSVCTCIQVYVILCACFVFCFFFEKKRHTSAAAEFPGKSEHIQKEKEGGGGGTNKLICCKREGIWKLEERRVKDKGKIKGISGSKMLTPGRSLAAGRRRMRAGFWVAIKSL